MTQSLRPLCVEDTNEYALIFGLFLSLHNFPYIIYNEKTHTVFKQKKKLIQSWKRKITIISFHDCTATWLIFCHKDSIISNQIFLVYCTSMMVY